MTRSEDAPRRSRRRRRRGPDPFSGLLLVDKPAGPTSHDVVARVRRATGFAKVGHGGTLDPFATGLLVLLLGRGATRLSARITDADKAYEGVARLGVRTDTMDREGSVVARRDLPPGLDADAIEAELARWRGTVEQRPPMYSAVKQGGVPLYKRARRGEVVDRPTRTVRIPHLEVTALDLPDAAFCMTCSKGTYVRALWDDIGEGLGCGAHLRSLRRTRIGALRLEEALPLDDVLALDLAALERACRPPEAAARPPDAGEGADRRGDDPHEGKMG